MLGGLDNPNEHHAAGGDGTVCEAVDEVAHEGDLMGDANAAGKHHNGTVGMQDMGAAIGTLDNGVDDNGAMRVLLSFLEELVREASAAADDERHCGALGRENVEATCSDALFRVNVLFAIAPGDGERMRGPQANRGDGEKDMLAWHKGPRTGHSKGDSDSIAWENFELGFGALSSKQVAVHDCSHADEALSSVS